MVILFVRWGGLSPRVRGNHRPAGHHPSAGGSIPACAGEPPGISESYNPGRVYPRVCGGTVGSRWTAVSSSGLSPRVRGNRGGTPPQNIFVGSIPACAGEPKPFPPDEVIPEVYPRVCGGTTCRSPLPPPRRGLSPRVRGNLLQGARGGWNERSIPACAGEPYPLPPRDASERVYPRVCGGTPYREVR